MKHLTLSSLLCTALFLTACGTPAPTVLTYDIDFTTEDRERMASLTLAARNVIERRLSLFNGELIDFDVEYDKEANKTIIEVYVDNEDAATMLNQELTAPFIFEIRKQVEEALEGDITVETGEVYRSTGITKEDINWVAGSAAGEGQGGGTVTIEFTESGSEEMRNVFEDNAGKYVGLFIRNRLAASILAENINFTHAIVIPNLPSADIAKIFADDVNVGIHMTFIPVQ